MSDPTHGHNFNTGKQTAWHVKEPVIKTGIEFDSEQVYLDPAKFRKLIDIKGVDVCVYRTSYCPKVKSIDGAEHEIDCDLCNGSGWVDRYPLKTVAFLQSLDLEKYPNLEGYVDGNNVTMSFPIGIELQYFNLVELTDFTDIYMQRVRRTEGTNTDNLKYHACRVNFLMDYNAVDYFQDSDFKINQEGNIEWLTTSGARKPADKLPYTVHYEAQVQFRAVKAMHVNRFTPVKVGETLEYVKLPEQWLMAKEFLVRRRGLDGNVILNQPYDSHELIDDDANLPVNVDFEQPDWDAP